MDDLLVKKAVAALGDTAGYELARQAVLSDTRMKAWGAFVENSMASGIRGKDGQLAVQGQTMTVGLLSHKAFNQLNAQGSAAMAVLHLEDRLIVGKKAARHAAAGNALSRQQWLDLPRLLQSAVYYFDKGSGNVVAVMDGGIPGDVIKVAFAPSGGADTAFRVSSASVEDAVKSGLWKLLDEGRGT